MFVISFLICEHLNTWICFSSFVVLSTCFHDGHCKHAPILLNNPSQQPQPESHDSHMEGYVVPEPAYDVAKKIMVKESTHSGPVLDSTVTEHQYSEIGGAINKEGV